MVLRICMFVLLLFLNYAALGAGLEGEIKTLHGRQDVQSGRGRTFVFEAPDDELRGTTDREKREAATATQSPLSPNTNIKTKLNHLNDTHKQLMVHWVGDDSNVVICLARDPLPTLQYVQINPSSVFISYDYGDTYEEKTSSFKMDNGNNSIVEKFIHHPKYNTHIIFTDLQNKLLFLTSNYGKNITKINLNFTPSDVSFHEYQPKTFVVLDKNDVKNKLWITHDFGQSWKLLQEYVKAFYWIEDKNTQQKLIIQRLEPSNLTTILYTSAVAGDSTTSIYASEVKDLFIKDDYIFYTMMNKKESYDLYVSYKFESKLQCIFDTELDMKAYHIADVSENRALIAVSHTNTLSHLYMSENLGGQSDKVRFTLSLESVLCYFPNSTWKDSWLHHISEEAFADVYKVEGLSGIYIASQITYKPQGHNLGPQHLSSRITFDHGASWRPIVPPQRDMEGQLISCSLANNCSLHLSQRFNHLYPETRSISILSSKSAPGIIVATGVIGKSLKGHFGVYISRDAGITWKQSLRDLFFFNMGDHGGILTAVKYLKLRGETRHILYSTDEGEKWVEESFNTEDMRLYGLMTEPGENTTVFTMFGSLPAQHQWIIVKLDLRHVFSYNCSADDYKTWSPRQSDGNNQYVPCILGQKKTFKRRVPHSNCYNGQDFDLPITMEACECGRLDYECDFGFVSTGKPWHCIKNRSIEQDPYQVPKNCAVGQTYNRTKGYRKIPGDMCINGQQKQYLPDIIHCPSQTMPNMLIYAQREKIMRMNLANNVQIQLQIPNLKNVIAIDFDVKNNCVYWADIVSDTIGRLCEDGISPPEVLVSTELVSVEGMALDWVSKNLYFVDGLRAKIELVRTNIHHSGRMRRTILDDHSLRKPRGIAVHPQAGYLFWTDWANANASVNRANLDGTNIKVIVNKSYVEWPNGITIDYIAERVYWVDAKEDYIGSTDLDGVGFKKIPIANDYVSHPFAVAVFKDDLYWDDWKRNSIFVSNKDHGGIVGTLIKNISGLMDLKVIAHGVQEGTNPCANSTCPYICVGSPTPPNYVCLCPDGMEYNAGKCLCPGGVTPYANFTCPKINGTCATDYFKCGNGLCIPNLWKCDDDNDCGDNSDELQCGAQTCAPLYFVCPDGKCLPHYWRCDYETDCSDGSDELNCPKQNCTSTQFTCDNGRCISPTWKCDGEDDCRDMSDEKDCYGPEPVTCKTDEFKCKSGEITCIPSTWKCDGEKDCRDKSDEINCSNNTCVDSQFSCGPPHNKCIYGSWRCDGEEDCENGSDEKNCTTVTPHDNPAHDRNPFQPINGSACLDYMFTCANKKCIPVWWKCDGANDCGDESDEQGCRQGSTTPMPPTTPWIIPHVCSKNQFQCESGECISMSWVCDNTVDCMNKEDEAHCAGATSCNHKDQFKCKMDGSCISMTDVCNGHSDCPDGSDESFCATFDNLPEPPVPSCSKGYFPCDIRKCFPLAVMCDNKHDCEDGTDENNCTNTTRIYQVLQMGVDERGINESSLLLYWWIAIPEQNTLEFMPTISTVKNPQWKNGTWTNHSEYHFVGLQPFTRYNMTVYVRINGTSTVFLPAKYYTATTGEGVPSEPYNIALQQQNGSDVLVTWSKPLVPNGIIQYYEICWSPPFIKMRLSDNSTSHLVEADFEPDVKYSFYVTAHNHVHSSKQSEIKSIKFDVDSEVGNINSLTTTNRTENAVSLKWDYNKPVDGFIVTIEARDPYPNIPPRLAYKNNITITNLAPGTYFTFKVAAFKKLLKGPENTTVTRTMGSPLPEVNVLEALVVKAVGTSVKITWDRPKDNRKVKWVYGIYYGHTEQETLEVPRYNTTALTATISNLDACEKYIFSVGVIGPLGAGPLSSKSPTVTTFLNAKAPPKKLNVGPVTDNHLQMMVQWSPSCSDMNTPIGYTINIVENVRNVTNEIALLNSDSQELSRIFNITYGGVYEVKVSTDVPEAIFTPTVTYRAPPILPPYELTIIIESNGSYIVYWQERNMPKELGPYHYVVFVTEGKDFNETTATKYEVKRPPFIYNNQTELMYTFAVQLKTDDGFKSLFSEVVSSKRQAQSWSEEIGQSSLASILVPVLLLLLVLGSALAFYVVKYRRLQTSFTRFANSHYDTRSEAATFDDNALEEDDSPQIRGFSDDEPLVIA